MYESVTTMMLSTCDPKVYELNDNKEPAGAVIRTGVENSRGVLFYRAVIRNLLRIPDIMQSGIHHFKNLIKIIPLFSLDLQSGANNLVY